MRPLYLASALALLALGMAAPSHADIYRWVDRSGHTRFSDRIEDVPPEWRTNVEQQIRANAAENAVPERTPKKPAAAPVGGAAKPAEPPRPTAAPSPGAAGRAPQASALGPLAAKLPWLGGLGVGPLLAILAGVVIGSFLLSGLLLQLATKLCGEEKPGLARALGILLVQMLVGIGVGLTEFLLLGAAGIGTSGAAFQGAQALLGFGANSLVLSRMQGLGFGKAAAIELVMMAISAGVGVAVVLGLGMTVGGFGLLHAKG